MDNNGKKIGGRKKGTPNKMTPERRAILADFHDTDLPALFELIKAAPLSTRIAFHIAILPYVLPKAPEERQGSEVSPVEELRGVVLALRRAHRGDDAM